MSDLQQVGGFLRVLRFPPPIKLTEYNWNIVESGVKHHQTNNQQTIHGEVYSIQHYVIKFVSDLRQVGGFFSGTPVYSTNKTDRHDITEIVL